MKFAPIASAVGLLALATYAGQALALPIVGGTTSVALTSVSTLTAAGLTVSGLGTAQVSPGSAGVPVAYFPVTGGNINTATFAGVIAHNGSGLKLTSATASISLTNFSIDTVTSVLSGSVAFGSTSLSAVPLFNLGASGVATAPFSLALTSAAAGALSSVFGVPNLTGFVIGNANTIPITSAVPETATVASMLAGLALMGGVLGRRRAAAAAT